MSITSIIGTGVACCGVLFFLFCAGLVFWYLLKQKPQEVSATAPTPPVQATIEHPTAGNTPQPSSEPTENSGADV